jgi:xanthine dehydrogenase small subunit
MAATAKRAPAAEQALVGQPWGEAAARAAMAALDCDFQPLSDLRASSRHRRRIAANLLWKLWLDTATDATHPAATPVGATAPATPTNTAAPAPLSVWAL